MAASTRPGRAPTTSRRLVAAAGLTMMAAVAAGPAACALDRAGTLEPPSTTSTGTGTGTGTGGSTSTGGSGGTGAGPQCTVGEDCPGQDTECAIRTCPDQTCEVGYTAPGTPCSEGDNDVCDGNGDCVKSDGLTCDGPAECLSGICQDSTCCATACDGVCESCDQVGHEGTCTLHPGATDPDSECVPGVCDGSGTCAVGEVLYSGHFGDGSDDYAWHVAVDAQGNVFVVGEFTGSLNLGGTTLTSAGGLDVFVAKFNSSGSHQWSQHYGNGNNQYANGVATDGQGNAIVVGNFWGSIDFGGDLLSANGGDVFVAKLDPLGNHLHSARFGGAGDQAARAVATDSANHYVITGDYRAGIDLGGGLLLSSGNLDVFIAKFSAAGDHQWSHGYNQGCDDRGWEVAVDSSNRIILGGLFSCAIDLGDGALTNAGGQDIYLAQFDSFGVHLWSQSYGGAANQRCFTVDVDPADNILLAGKLWGSADFGGGDLTDAGSGDAFVAKLDSGGNHQWSHRFGDASEQGAFAVETDGSGNVILFGEFLGSMDFGLGTLTTAGSWDLFAAKLAPDGVALWSQRFGDANIQWGNDAAVDPSGNVWLTGHYTGTLDFGAGALTSTGGFDIYLAELSP